ncbi:MAG: acetate kinase [Spirochaetia bacterium]|nr:acetate kinase [Spirochaetia bacterium]
MVILTLNCGSSSLKYQLYDWQAKEVLAVGAVERIGQNISSYEHTTKHGLVKDSCTIEDHKRAFALVLDLIVNKQQAVIERINSIKAVGHRVVHGAEYFTKSVIIDEIAMKLFESLVSLAPLHMPANLTGIKAAKELLPDIPHCAIMDTAWHQTMGPESFMYALPYDWYTRFQIRRYGFHGTSYIYTAKRAAVLLGKNPRDTNLIIAHIGNGASICAVKNGVCIDTSMGFTPLEGLIMGTRSGDIDPAIIPYMMEKGEMSAREIDAILNKNSGLLAISGKYTDRRDIRDAAANDDERCALAIKMECHRLKKYIGAYLAIVGAIDAIVFTAGVGEMAPHIRLGALSGLEHLGISIDKEKNQQAMCRNAELCISTDTSKIKVFIIPTDEELVMTEDTYALLNNTYDVHTRFTYSFESKEYVNKARARAFKEDLKKRGYLSDLLIKC